MHHRGQCQDHVFFPSNYHYHGFCEIRSKTSNIKLFTENVIVFLINDIKRLMLTKRNDFRLIHIFSNKKF